MPVLPLREFSGDARSRRIDIAIVFLLMAGIAGLFYFDISAPRGQIDGAGYAAVVALCFRFGRRIVIGCAVAATVLTVAAHFLVLDEGISVAGELENRFFAIASIWIVALILIGRFSLESELLEREVAAKHHQDALLRIVREAVSSQEPLVNQVQALTEIAGQALQVERTGVFILNEDGRAYRCLDLWQRTPRTHGTVPDMLIKDSPGYFEAIGKQIVLVADDALKDPLVRRHEDLIRERNIGAMIVAGIFVEGQMQGLLSMGHAKERRNWTFEEIGFVRSLSGVLSQMLLAAERAKLEANLQGAARMQALGQLAGGIAHDFSNILSAISGFAGLIEQDLPQNSPQRMYARRILGGCDRGKELVEQILAFARVQGTDRRRVGLRHVLRESEALLAGSLPKTTDITFEYPREGLTIAGRDIQISQLVVNLCHNASDAFEGKPGSIRVKLEYAAPDEIASLSVATDRPGELTIGRVDPALSYARISVSDTGPGIPPAILKRVFEPFFTTKGKKRGSGLGLAVVHGVVESHGGACHVKSNPGTGTVFDVYLPLARVDGLQTALPESSPADEDLAGKERILIVDDETDITDMLSIGFNRLGYEAVGVNDPLEALAAFEEDPSAWDAVIADQLMPEMRGLDLVRKLKVIRPDLAAIVCTGYSDDVRDEDSREAGVDAFLRKPVDARGIAPQLRAILNGRSGERREG
jgi:signal transduction histidine kinase/ActR/RegA family two-component response regulator